MKKIAFVFIICLITNFVTAQEQPSQSPYHWNWVTDGIWTGAALGGSVTGFLLIQNKDDITEDELAREIANKDNINFLDRWVVGNHDENANNLSDIPFAASFATPLILLFDEETNEHYGQISGLYLESLATTAAMYTITAGLVNRSRPYVYDETGDTSLSRRLSGNGQRSFYSGHVGATATATFFSAKVFSDFNPDAKGKFWIWTGAAVLPAGVAYFRLQAGQHFLTDIMLGYALGAATGILVPELHKTKDKEISFYPTGGRTVLGEPYKAMAIQLQF